LTPEVERDHTPSVKFSNTFSQAVASPAASTHNLQAFVK